MNKTVIAAIAIVLIVAGIILGWRVLRTPLPQDFKEAQLPEIEEEIMESTMSAKTYSQQPSMSIDESKTYTATVSTSKGVITLELYAKENPVTVNNFVFLAREGFYNGTIFHRIIKDFMIQGGDPKGDGTGDPGYTFNDEKITREYTRGTIAMANAGPNTNGSQFFIMHADYALPKNYVIFGRVTQGLDTVDAIANTPVTTNAFGESSTPTEEVVIEKVEIGEK